MILLLAALAAQADEPVTIDVGNMSAGSVNISSDASGKRISIDWLEVDGARIETLSCGAQKLPFLGAMVLGPAVGAGAKAAQACQKTGGGAVKARWTWAAGATSGVELVGIEGGANAACVSAALATMPAPIDGQCEALVLLGEREAALAAAVTLHGP